jgi:hypothetical protein
VKLIESPLRAPDQSPAGNGDSSVVAVLQASIERLIAKNAALIAEIAALTVSRF